MEIFFFFYFFHSNIRARPVCLEDQDIICLAREKLSTNIMLMHVAHFPGLADSILFSFPQIGLHDAFRHVCEKLQFPFWLVYHWMVPSTLISFCLTTNKMSMLCLGQIKFALNIVHGIKAKENN